MKNIFTAATIAFALATLPATFADYNTGEQPDEPTEAEIQEELDNDNVFPAEAEKTYEEYLEQTLQRFEDAQSNDDIDLESYLETISAAEGRALQYAILKHQAENICQSPLAPERALAKADGVFADIDCRTVNP